MARDSDRMAVWDAKARALVDRIDAALGEDPVEAPEADTSTQLNALVRRVMLRTQPPGGEILRPASSNGDILRAAPPNMGPQPDRFDHWDAYVCKFDADEEPAT